MGHLLASLATGRLSEVHQASAVAESFDVGVQGKVAEGNATEIPWDPEHVNIGNECDKILLHSAETDGISGILKVRPTLQSATVYGCHSGQKGF